MTPRLGILMLDTAFPRPLGDIGHPGSFGFPVTYARVSGASAEAAVLKDATRLLPPFIEAGRALIAAGCTGLGTSCGFLGPLQRELSDALGVPVAASALSLVPMVAPLLPQGSPVGILTIRADALGPAHLSAAGIDGRPPIAGCDPDGVFCQTIFRNAPSWDAAAAREDVVKAAQALVSVHPQVGGLVLECTNMGPYAADIRAATGRPVWSVIDLLTWFAAGLPPPQRKTP